jgi:hypothetical protein
MAWKTPDAAAGGAVGQSVSALHVHLLNPPADWQVCPTPQSALVEQWLKASALSAQMPPLQLCVMQGLYSMLHSSSLHESMHSLT